MTPKKTEYKPGPVATTYVEKNEYLTLILEDLMDMGFYEITFKNHVFTAKSQYDAVNERIYGVRDRAETYNYFVTCGLLVRAPWTNGRHHNWALTEVVNKIEACLSPDRKSYSFHNSPGKYYPKYAFLAPNWTKGFVLFESPDFPMQHAYLEMKRKERAVVTETKGNEMLRGKIRGLQVDLDIGEKRVEKYKNELLQMQDSFICNYPNVTPEQIAEWRIS
jgi:hypothetical protein